MCAGGRVGKGIYLASEQSKSAGYVRPGKQGGRTVGVMFLVQAALGKQHTIEKDDWQLQAPPKGVSYAHCVRAHALPCTLASLTQAVLCAGYDSILAKGRTEPEPGKETSLKIGGTNVAVPQGTVQAQADAKDSYFFQSEYLVYKEAQQRLRYVITFDYA